MDAYAGSWSLKHYAKFNQNRMLCNVPDFLLICKINLGVDIQFQYINATLHKIENAHDDFMLCMHAVISEHVCKPIKFRYVPLLLVDYDFRVDMFWTTCFKRRWSVYSQVSNPQE